VATKIANVHAVTELESTVGEVHGRPRKKIVLIAVGMAMVAVVGLAVVLIVRGGGYEVRYEIETSSGNSNGILWSVDTSHFDKKVPDSADGTIATPWSKVVRFKDENQLAALATEVRSGTATCRIFVDGKKVAEDTSDGEATCQTRVG
jgi:hypothetical protein